MFTECPECSTAFRVTAKVLQQAAGRVRCGGCGHAFSALEHLTEDLPGTAAAQETYADDEAPESELTSEEKFRETSKQLLQTLDELAGTDEVRIEDTGFEWQVLDEDAIEDEDVEGQGAAEPAAEASGSQELLELEVEADTEVAYDGDALTEPAFDDSGEDGITLEAANEAHEEDIAIADSASDAEEWNETPDDAEGEESAADEDDLPLEVEEELAAIHSELSTKEGAEPADLDSQFEMQAEAMGIDSSGSHDIPDDEPTVKASLEDEEDIALEAPDEEEVATEAASALGVSAGDEFTVDASLEDAADIAAQEIAAEETPAGPEEDEAAKGDDAAAFTPDADVLEEALESSGEEEAIEPAYSAVDDVPEMSEEEATINQEIDQELLAIAQEDQDLKSTIIGLENSEKLFDEESADVETIVMEGEAIRGAFEKEREREKKEAALKRFDKAGNLIDSYITRRAIRGGRRATDPPSYGAIAAAALLVLALFGQIVHANRDSLSTSELFNQTVGQVYRVLGKPITPEWSIKGWQFEATNGSIAEGDDVLTIFSRIGNRSEQPLPYPLVHVSLTDRWEEIIGSAILEPGEYLAADQNPNQPVTPGDNFTAVITIDEPSVDATGFKLNVCYRLSPGRVRCATEDFKD